MIRQYMNLSDAWNHKCYGPFKTRAGLSVYTVDKAKHPELAITYFEMSDDRKRLPSGSCFCPEHYNDFSYNLYRDNVHDIASFQVSDKKETIVTDSRLVHLQKTIKQAKKDLKRYIKQGYPIGSKIAVPKRGGLVLMQIVEHGPKVLKGVEVKTGKRIQINYELITGRYKTDKRKR